MALGHRVRDLMAEKGLSQAELARRIGVAQPSIYAIIHRNKTGTRTLHKLARELETTAAYLSGETDDPAADQPTPTPISSDAREMVDHFESLGPADRRALLQIARSMAAGGAPPSETVHARGGEGKAATVHDKRPEFRGED